MAKVQILKGSTSVLVRVFIQDTRSTAGAGLAALTNGSSGLTCYVARDDDGNAAATQLALSGGTRGTWSSGGFKEKDATNQPGVYELGLSNASLATGSRSATYYLQGAANMAPCVFEVELTNTNNQAADGGLVLAKTTNITGLNDIAATAIVSAGAINTASGAVSTVAAVTGLTASNLDATISSRLASASYTAPSNASIASIKTKTDSLNFTVAGQVDANTQYVNDVAVTGTGASGDEWGPA